MLTLRTFIKHQYGSYSCVIPSVITKSLLTSYMNEHLSSYDNLIMNDLHCTITYSREPVAAIELIEPEFPIYATAKKFSLFGEENDTLVLEIESEELLRIYNQSRDLGATSDWPNYKPHITLAKNVVDIDVDDLPLPDFGIVFDSYKVEGLDESK